MSNNCEKKKKKNPNFVICNIKCQPITTRTARAAENDSFCPM